MVHNDGVKADVPVIRVRDTEQAFLDLARAYRRSFDIPVVALTGSVGKTTTKEMIWHVLSAKYNAHKTEGNLNNSIGVPKVLLGLEAEHTAAVVEMGNYFNNCLLFFFRHLVIRRQTKTTFKDIFINRMFVRRNKNIVFKNWLHMHWLPNWTTFKIMLC